MNRIDRLFREKRSEVLAVYFTAGYCNGENAADTVAQLANAGVDLIEVGMPFSDPLADGPVIQESSSVALKNGMTISRLFAELKALRNCTEVPVVLMGYLNPVMQFGMEAFLAGCAACGIDGIILPDLPVEEYRKYEGLFEQYGVYPVFLVSPSTPPERVRLIAGASKGFVYVLSASATTGANVAMADEQLNRLNSTLQLITDKPTLVGFGIHDHSSFETFTAHANGGVVGSAFIRELKNNNVPTAIERLMRRIKTPKYDHSAI